MKTKESILISMCVLLPYMLFAQEPLIFVVENDSTAYRGNDTFELHTGDRIIMDDMIINFGPIYREAPEYHIKFYFTGPNSNVKYSNSALARDFRPANTEETFGEDVFIDYPPDIYIQQTYISEEQFAVGDANEMWVPGYYCDVLAERNRGKLIEIHPGLDDLNDVRAGDEYIWYDNTKADIQNGRAMFYNAVIKLGLGTHFAVRNIIKTTYGYSVDCIESIWDGRYPPTSFSNSVFWDRYKPGDAMTLYIYLDGDYMDIYVDGKDILLGTFVKVKREFIKQYQSLIKTNTCDLTNVQWPRRADGSTNYSTPLITSVLEEDKQSELIELSVDTENSRTTQNSAKKSAMPLWARLAIIGGVVVVGGAAVFILKRKK